MATATAAGLSIGTHVLASGTGTSVARGTRMRVVARLSSGRSRTSRPFRNVAEHLAPGGHFVIETGVPPLRHLPPGQGILGYRAGPGRIVSYSFDHATERYRGHYVEFTDGTGE